MSQSDSTIWVSINGYEGRYEVNRLGQIRNTKTAYILKPSKDNYGYSILTIRINGKKKTHKVHRLIAMTFIPNIYNKPQINHKNGIKADNRIDNLEWCTNRENTIHAIKTGLRKVLSGDKSPSAKLNKEQVMAIRHKYATGLYYQRELAKEYGVSRGAINSIMRFTTWSF